MSQVKPPNCFRRLEKLVLPSIFDKSFILDDVKLISKLRVIQQQFWMKECDFFGVKTYSVPSYIFSGGHELPTSRIYAPALGII